MTRRKIYNLEATGYPVQFIQVVMDDSGESKGFGFVRFNDETEQQTALTSMQGISGLGSRPIKVSIAVQKAKDPAQPSFTPNVFQPPTPDQARPPLPGAPAAPQPAPGYGGAGYDAGYYNQYNNYWSNMAAWQQYNQYYQGQPGQGYPGGANGAPASNVTSQPPPLPSYNTGNMRRPSPAEVDAAQDSSSGSSNPAPTISNPALQFLDDNVSILDGPLNQPVDHSKPIDYYKLNRRYFSSSADLYDALDESGWGTIEDTV